MNIIEILWKLGYDVLSFNEEGEYKVIRTHDRQLKYGYIQDTYLLKVDDVSFNGFGNLYVSFKDVKTGDLMDVYEYKNMSPDELY